MSVANDKKSSAIRNIGANALVAARVLASGFQNVLHADSFAFASGNGSTRLVFVGEEAPSTTYDTVARVGDEYWRVVYTAGLVTAMTKYIWTTGGWERMLTQNDTGYDVKTVSNIVTAGAGTYTAAQIVGGIITRDPTGAARTDTTATAAQIVAAITAAAVGTTITTVVKNTADADELITLAGGVGVTLSPTVIKIKPGTSKTLVFRLTNVTGSAEAVTCYDFDTLRDEVRIYATTDATAGAKTWAAADLLSGLLLRDPAGADRSDVTPTAALIVAAVPDKRVGSTFEFLLVNTADADEVITLTAGVGVTLSPATIKVGRNGRKRLVARLTNITGSAEAVTIYDADEVGYSPVTAGVLTKKSTVTVAAGGAVTLTAAQMLGGYIQNDPAGDVNGTTDTAANIVAAIPNCQIGSSFEFTLENTANGAETITVVAGAGVTAGTSHVLTVARTYAKRFLCVVTNVGTPAVSLYVTGHYVANAL